MNTKEALLDLLEKKRVIYVNGKITPDTAREFGLAVMWLNAQNSNEIKLIIDSDGGSAAAGLDMYDMINFSKAPMTGIVYGYASSMASVILQACDKRYALPHANILIHYLRTSEIPLNEIDEDIEKALRFSRDRQNSINGIYGQTTGRSLEEIQDTLKKNKMMTAQEAMEFGLIDEIITTYDI